MNDIMLDLGWFQIKWYSFILFLAMLMASIIIYQESKKKGLSEEQLIDILFYGILTGILGARIYYVLFNLDYYSVYPTEIIKIWHGGLAIHGGLIAGLIFIIGYCRKNKINTLLLLDIIVVGLIMAQAIGRWGNFFNQEAYGRVVDLDFLKSLHLPQFIIDGMYINKKYREPTFLYESVFSLLGFIVLITIRKIKKIKIGQLSAIYLLWYGVERWIIESFRSDSLMLGNFKIAQIVSILSIILGIYLFQKNIKNNRYYQREQLV